MCIVKGYRAHFSIAHNHRSLRCDANGTWNDRQVQSAGCSSPRSVSAPPLSWRTERWPRSSEAESLRWSSCWTHPTPSMPSSPTWRTSTATGTRWSNTNSVWAPAWSLDRLPRPELSETIRYRLRTVKYLDLCSYGYSNSGHLSRSTVLSL